MFDTANTARQQAFKQWLGRQLGTVPELAPLGGDAGGRRYYALAENPAWLAVDAPPDSENTQQFIALANVLSAGGVRVPRIHSADEHNGFLLVENLGEQLLADAVKSGRAGLWYPRALATLGQIARLPTDSVELPPFDDAFIKRELAIFRQWFAEKLLGVTIDGPARRLLDELDDTLSQCILSQPQVFMHRDYHARNLLLAGDDIAVIDFQDAVTGPLAYDLVSLLKDCYLTLPQAQVRTWALAYKRQAEENGLMPATEENDFLRAFDWVGLQRHIKVLGIFARLHLRDGKPGYLADLPRVLQYVLEVLTRYPEFHPVHHWFERTLIPVCRRQPWYRQPDSGEAQ